MSASVNVNPEWALTSESFPIDFGAVRALVVEDYPSMCNALRQTLYNFGITKVQLAGSAAEAIYHVKARPFDFILCDFNLGDSRDGQQLLEELRHGNLISLNTVFMMVTAESFYEKVAATAELAPDDYMIKPFSPEVLRNRLESILLRKRAFRDVYRHFTERNLEASVDACDELITGKPKYLVDALRFKGELLIVMGQPEAAEVLYQQVIAMRAIPWARLGLARALHMQQKDDAAEAVLREALEQAPEMVAAYDLLSEVCLSKRDAAAAQKALERGVSISGRTVRRQQKLGEIAHANGDLDVARTAYTQALDKGRYSIFVTPGDYGNLCRVQVEQGDLDGAADTLKKGKNTLMDSPEGQLVMAVAQGVIHTKSGNMKGAEKALDEAAALCAAGARGDDRLMLDLASTCMANGRNDEADGIVAEVARNAHDSDALLSRARKIYEDAGLGDSGTAVLDLATTGVRKLNNEGVMLAQRGDLRAAADKLLAACDEAPRNPRILMNAVWVIFRYIDQDGMNERLFETARQYLDEAERLAPGHARIAGFRLTQRELETRFGKKRRQAR